MKEKISYWINKDLKKSCISEEDHESISDIYKYLVCHYLITNDEDYLMFYDSSYVGGMLFISDEFCGKYYDEFSFVRLLPDKKKIELDQFLLKKVKDRKIKRVNKILRALKYKENTVKEFWLKIPENFIFKFSYPDLAWLLFIIFKRFKLAKKLAFRFYILEDEKILKDFINSIQEKNIFSIFWPELYSFLSREEVKEVFNTVKESQYFFKKEITSLCERDSILNPLKSKDILKLIQEYME